MSESEIQAITDRCYQRHAEQIVRSNTHHLSEIKKAIATRVTLPVTILCGLLGWLLFQVYMFKGQTSAQEQILDTQTMQILGEEKQRELSDANLENKIKELQATMDTNTKWLIENMYSKSRGNNPLLDRSNTLFDGYKK